MEQEGKRLKAQEKDRIKSAIRHIKTSGDVDEWAVEIAVEAMKKQFPMHPAKSKKPRYGMGYEYYDWVCPTCGCFLVPEPQKIGNHHCKCGQAIDWGIGE